MMSERLNKRITIQQIVETLDQYNTPTQTWQDFATVWAAVEPISGKEYLQANNITAVTTIRIRIRYLKGVTVGMRVKYGDRLLDIQTVMDIQERHREMELICIEGGTNDRPGR